MGLSRVLMESTLMNRARLGRLAVLFGVLAVACTKPTAVVPVASIQLQPSLDSIEVGETFSNWLITLRDATGNELTGRQLSWNSQNESVATVNSTGVVTAIGAGQSLITVSSEGKSAQATVKVINPILSIVASPDSMDVPLTTQRTIAVQLVGPGGQALSGRNITWASSNPSVAAISSQGVVTPIALGTVTITIFAGTKTATVRVRVVPEPVASVRITPQQSVQVIRLGQAVQLGAECLNATQIVLTGRTVTWNSSNPLVASVGSTTGLVSGIALGQAQITATCENASASVLAQVTPVPVTSVSITPAQMLLNVGQQGQMSATARDSANNVLSLVGRQVIWTSDNLPVATVSNAGVVSAVAAGVSNIQVSVDGVLSATVPVTVQPVPVATVVINQLNPAVVCGQQILLTATTKDANGNTLNGRAITWSSANTAIATIGPNSGVATGVVVGMVQITAISEGVPGTVLLSVTFPPAPQPQVCP